MPIRPKQAIITRRDFQDALDLLGVGVSEVSKASGIPRAYLSDLKTRGVELRRGYAVKLKDYLTSKGVEFVDAPADDPDDDPDDDAPAPPIVSPRARSVETIGPVHETFSDDTLMRVRAIMEDNEAELLRLLKIEVRTKPRPFLTTILHEEQLGDDIENDANMNEAKRLMAENYLLARWLKGWPVFALEPKPGAQKTTRELILKAFGKALNDAGLIQANTEDTTPAERAAPVTSETVDA